VSKVSSATFVMALFGGHRRAVREVMRQVETDVLDPATVRRYERSAGGVWKDDCCSPNARSRRLRVGAACGRRLPAVELNDCGWNSSGRDGTPCTPRAAHS
jgi:hypothetical protein